MDKITNTLRKLRANNIEPDVDFLEVFTTFEDKVQDNLINMFKKHPEITSGYKWIK
tara:strand:- start:297 stop:464 length:168 start_codon:yes stop_codon:yes gene_type:complete